ncbi:uncharacterized protein UHOD_00106 [Ustilago sp. UG-2017b]|nr:uncharacterized protein UHOD_00106 [Ustilago sp. UG-2017b]
MSRLASTFRWAFVDQRGNNSPYRAIHSSMRSWLLRSAIATLPQREDASLILAAYQHEELDNDKLIRLSTLSALLLSNLTIPTNALDFSVSNINCSQLDWTATLTQTEWSVASYIELFFISTQGARNYTLLCLVSNTGEFPTPGAYSKTTLFGDTALTGGYRVGIGLTDTNGNILTTTASSNESPVQVTSIDDRSFTFGDCARSASAGVGVGSAASTAASTTVAPSATPSILSTRIVASSTVTTSSTSASATAAPINTI